VTLPQFTDRRTLTEQAYADPMHLSARQRLWSYRAGLSFHERMVDAVEWSGFGSLLDVGCGNAVYLPLIMHRLPAGASVIGVDLSLGMLASARHPTGRVAADVEALPFGAQSFDAALAFHMLYHAPHPPTAVAELHRVIRSGGAVIVTTNGPRHFEELRALGSRRPRPTDAVGLDEAQTLLEQRFSTVERREFLDDIVVPGAGPVIDYLRSTVSFGANPKGLEVLERRVRETVEREGCFRLTAQPGFLIAR
jgi:ubiquinone/menaquinone biosynthesis C-methylase UbiE